jgi:16S rRNA (cytosine967-C5)-methyltransferase
VLTSSRSVAFDILADVERGGFASDLLLERSAGLDSRDAGLTSEIVFGTLRYQLQLDFLVEHYSGRTAQRLDSEVRIALRMGIYQLRYLDRIPRHAAVAESVELIKRARKRSAAGFVNAVLRKVDRSSVAWPDRAVALSHPEWLLARWERQFGPDAAEGIARANLRPPEPYVRIPARCPLPPGLEATNIPGCYRGLDAEYRQMDISSQSIVPLLGLRPGDRFLDLCAAPGNKTAQALEAPIHAVACDAQFNRLSLLKELPASLVQLDARQPLPFGQVFDRVLVDAPCSGTGTLSRNPEIKWRLQEADLAAFRERQKAILQNALEVLKPDGLLVYSTCSLEREENEDVAGPFAERTIYRIPGRDAGDGFFAAMIHSG